MITKNDKIKQVKEIDGFNRIGEIFEVTNVSEDGIISFKCDFGYGVMSYNEFEKSFEKVEELIWGNWIKFDDYDESDYKYKYKTNNKVITMKCLDSGYEDLMSKSTCSEGDIFDLNKGIKLCIAKIRVKQAERYLEKLLQEM